METLSYGFKKPATGDRGSVFWSALENNAQKTNDHTHDGSNSSKIQGYNVALATQDLSAGIWVSHSQGVNKMLVTIPNGLTFDTCTIKFRLASGTKSPVLLSAEYVSPTTYYIYSNSNLLLTAHYLT